MGQKASPTTSNVVNKLRKCSSYNIYLCVNVLLKQMHTSVDISRKNKSVLEVNVGCNSHELDASLYPVV